MSIPTSFIDQLLDQTDIVDVVGRRIPLNKKGANFWCQCPFHDDSNPSMACLLYTSPSPRDRQKSRMPSSA